METDGVVLCNQVRTLDLKARGGKYIEQAPDHIVDEVSQPYSNDPAAAGPCIFTAGLPHLATGEHPIPAVASGESNGRTMPEPSPARRLYTPATLAAEWGCSPRHVRNLINRGELRAFRLGRKLLRITTEAAEEYRCRSDTRSDDSPANASSSTTTTPASATDTGSELMRRIELKSLRRRSTPN